MSGSERVDYDRVAPAYDRRYAAGIYGGVADALADFVGASPAVRVLEVGCGTGHWLGVLSERGLRPTGIDASAGMLAEARSKTPAADLIHGFAESLPWRSQSFDRLVCINAFHHFIDQSAFLREAHRVLDQGGAAMIVGLDPHTGRDRWCIYDYFPAAKVADERRYISAARIRAALKAAGFADCTTVEAERMELRLPARAALDAGLLDRRFTSQLTILSDADYDAGIERIRSDAAAAELRGEALELVTDVRLYATFGRCS